MVSLWYTNCPGAVQVVIDVGHGRRGGVVGVGKRCSLRGVYPKAVEVPRWTWEVSADSLDLVRSPTIPSRRSLRFKQVVVEVVVVA